MRAPKPFWTIKIAWMLIAVSAISGCQSGGSGKAPSQSLEARTGEEIQQEILSKFYVYTEPEVNRYGDHVGHRISQYAKRNHLPYEFTVLYDDRIYASSAPGGKVFLTTGLIAFLENEAELAGVLAHEIGELQYQPPALSPAKKMASQIEQGSAMAAPFFGGIGILAFLGIAGATAAVTMEKPKEKRVLEADKLALGYMVEAGYDPQGWLDVLYRLIDIPEEKTYLIADFYWSRPITVKRMKRLKVDFRKLSLVGMQFSTDRETFLDRIKPVSELYKK